MAHVLVLRWTGSAFESVSGMLDLAAQELRGLGHAVTAFPVAGAGWGQRLAGRIEAEQFDFALTMSGVGVDVVVPGKGLLWDVAKLPLFNWNCDHPCYFPPRHGVRSRFVLHGYLFADHAQYNLQHLNPNGLAFAVHLGLPPRSLFPGAPLPAGARNGRIIFTKSGKDSNAIAAEWRERAPPLRDILLTAAEELLHQSTAACFPVVQRIAGDHGLFLAGNGELALGLIRELDDYLRFRRGDMLVRTLLDYPVDVIGPGWEHIPWHRAGAAAHHGALPWRTATFERLPHYLASLSLQPLVEQSVHDREFYALAAGVVPLSDDNAFAQACLPALQPYRFDFTRERIVAAADALLSDPAAALQRTEAAWQGMQPAFTLRQAMMQIVDYAALYPANRRWGG